MSKTVKEILKEYEQQKGMGKEPVILINAVKLIRDMYEDVEFPLDVADKAYEKIEKQHIGYDVNNVCKQLKEWGVKRRMPIANGTLGYVDYEVINSDKAIELVNAGGISK